MKKLITSIYAVILMLFCAGSVYASDPGVRGLTMQELEANDAESFCTGSSGMCSVNSIPTLEEWGIIVFSILLMATGIFFMLKYRQTRAFFFALMLTITGGLVMISAHAIALTIGTYTVTTITRPRPGESEFTAAERDTLNARVARAYPCATRIGNPTITFDCHGYTFDASRSWINDDQVDNILGAGVYNPVVGAKRVGDIIIYRDGSGNVTHSGVVTAVDGLGNVTEVTSKWGALGTYRHAPNCGPYGTNISYYR